MGIGGDRTIWRNDLPAYSSLPESIQRVSVKSQKIPSFFMLAPGPCPGVEIAAIHLLEHTVVASQGVGSQNGEKERSRSLYGTIFS